MMPIFSIKIDLLCDGRSTVQSIFEYPVYTMFMLYYVVFHNIKAWITGKDSSTLNIVIIAMDFDSSAFQ